VPNILVVQSSYPINTAKDLIAQAKAYPGKLNYGSGGVGSSQHLASEMLKTAMKLDVVHVPYKGTAGAEVGLLGGEIHFLLDTTACLPFISAGKMKALAVASKVRNPALPNVPTFDEVGIPGIYAGAWYGLMAPAGTPKDIVDKVAKATLEVLDTPEMKKRMIEFGAENPRLTGDDFQKFIVSEIERYKDIVKLAGAKVE
jgi:tripartite-type tricarboxylate transporter receptor subunit TctC